MSLPVPARSFVALALAAALSAQIPPGHFVVAAAQTQPPNTPWTGSPGLQIGHPRTPGDMVPVTGLPGSLTSPAPNTGNGWYGVGAIAMHGGEVLLGDIPYGTTPNPVSLHRVHVDPQSFAATVVSTHVLGVGTNGDVNQIVSLGDERCVVACNNVNGPAGSGPLAIATVDLVSGAITPWPISSSFAAYEGQAICVDVAGDVAYVGGALPPVGAASSQIWLVPLSSPTVRIPLATVPVFLDNLQFDAATGTVVAGGRSDSPGNGAIFRIDPATIPATVTVLLPNWQNAPAIAVEPTTGDVLFAGVQMPGSTPVGIWHLASGSPTPAFLGNTLPGGSGGVPLGIAVAPAPEYYGDATAAAPLAARVPWRRHGLTGGLPLVGNSGFVLELDVPANVSLVAGVVFGSLGSSTPNVPQVLGLDLNIDVSPSSFVGGAALGGATVPLPLANDPLLQGLTLHLQALTITTAGTATVLGASDGAKVTVL